VLLIPPTRKGRQKQPKHGDVNHGGNLYHGPRSDPQKRFGRVVGHYARNR
jgi:hypothetical protein